MNRIFTILLLLTSQLVYGQDNAEKLTRSFIALLEAGGFEEASGQFSDQVAAQITTEKLEEIWKTINQQAGAFQQIEDISVDKKEAFAVVVALCKFEKAYLNVQLAFNGQQEVSGMFFRPGKAPEAPTYQIPDYASEESYTSEELTLQSPVGPLKAIYTKPKGVENPPIMVLVHGSGPNDEDETLGPNKLFVDLATGLATKGIATFRYVKRSKAYPGSFGNNTTINDEVVLDAVNAIEKASRLSEGKILVLGHSLGGMMLPQIVTVSKKAQAGIIFAGNSRPLEQLMIEQVDYILANESANGQEDTYAMIKKAAAKLQNRDFDENTPPAELMNIGPAYWADLLKYDQKKTAKKAKVPLLIMQGERDYQVTMKDFEGWKKALGKKAQYRSYPKLNHMFLEGEGICLPAEYNEPGKVPEYVIDDLVSWIESVR
ncbi:MAG: DUF3887 domain-containing protein [Bacteroidota bacterium]